jgi:hypothetical protein
MAAKLTSGIKSLNLIIDTPYDSIRTTDIRDDLIGVKVWYSTTSGFTPPAQGTLAYDGTGLNINISGPVSDASQTLDDNTTYYVKYALISSIDPDTYDLSTELSATTLSTVALLSLETTDWAFIFPNKDATTATNPASITFTAKLQNVTGTPVFSATAYNASNTSLGAVTLTGTGNTRTLTSANFNALGATTVRYVKVQVTLGTLSDTITIWRGDNGSDALTFILTNESHTVPAANDGTVSSYAGAVTYGAIFRGIVNETYLWTITKSDSTGLTTTLTPATIGQNNITVTATNITNAVDSAVCTITATRTGYPTLTKDFSLSKSKAGAQGAQGIQGTAGAPGNDGRRTATGQVYYSLTSASQPSAPTATSFTFSSASFSNLTSNWALGAPTFAAGNSNKYWYSTYTVVESAAGTGSGTPTFSSPTQAIGFSGLVTFTSGTPTTITTDGNTTFDYTSIDGGAIKTGSISSQNHTGTGDGSNYATTGTKINLSNGTISTPGLYLNSTGNVGIKGSLVTATTGRRIEFNVADSNKIRFYNASNTSLGHIGGTGEQLDKLLNLQAQFIGTQGHTAYLASPGPGSVNLNTGSYTASALAFQDFNAIWAGALAEWSNSGTSLTGVAVGGYVVPSTGTDKLGALGYRDDGLGITAAGRFWNSTVQQHVTICDNSDFAINIRSGQLRYGSVTIGIPDGSTDKYLKADGTWATVTAGVSKIIAGTGVSISPTAGVGDVTINASGSSLPSGGTTAYFLRGDGTWSNTLQGNLIVTGEVTAYSGSDANLKQNIKTIVNPLDKLLKLGGYDFTWKQDYLNTLAIPNNYAKQDDVGIIAQEVQAILPQAVVTRDDGTLAVNYSKLIPLIIEAIKELHKKVVK